MKIEDYLAEKFGFSKSVRDGWLGNVQKWASWYQGDVKDFHTYEVYNGQKSIKCRRWSLQMAKKVCEDWADLLVNEHCKATVESEESQKRLDELLTKVDFWAFANDAVERSGSTGTGAIVTSVQNFLVSEDGTRVDMSEATPGLEYVDAEWIFPISWRGPKITECAFGAERTVKGKRYVLLSIHTLDEKGEYIISNRAFEISQSGNATLVQQDESIEDFVTGSTVPWFAIISPSGVNNVLPGSPWGLPYFANSIDRLKGVDLAYDGLCNEVNLGRKRVFVRSDMLNIDTVNGEVRQTFDPNDVSVYALPEGSSKDDLIQTDADNIRADAFIKSINITLSLLSEGVGMGKDHYSFDGSSVRTATEVVSQNSQLFRRKKKHEIRLESALYDVVVSLAYASSAFAGVPIDTTGLSISFDDSIIEDTEAISNRAMREYNAGVLSGAEYRMKVFHEDEQTARRKIEEIKAQERAAQPLPPFGDIG